IVPQAIQGFQALHAATGNGDVPPQTLALVHLRASQINGCGTCVDAGSRQARKSGVSEERLCAVAAWRSTPYFSDAERAAPAPAESGTRLCDRMDPVSDEVWREGAPRYDERA